MAVAPIKQHQRKKASLVDPVIPGWRIERASRDRVAAIARKSGISASQLVDLMIEHLELTDQGVPPWIPELPRDGEIDMSGVEGAAIDTA